MLNSVADGSDRAKGIIVVKPIVYGNISKRLDECYNNSHTHKWTVYLRPYYNEDLSQYIKKVVFKLHDSYPDKKRCVMRPPFEITETGWGEFEVIISVHFQCPKEKPIVLKHYLKLFRHGTVDLSSGEAFVSEFYDEIIFQEPTLTMMTFLVDNSSSDYLQHCKNYEDEKLIALQAILEGRKKVKTEIASLKSKILLVSSEISKLQETLPLSIAFK